MPAGRRGGKLPRYRCRLGCILLKMAAISLLTGILGVPADAKDKAIKKAYHKLSCAAPGAPTAPAC